MESEVDIPVNIGSDEMISINDFSDKNNEICAKKSDYKNIPGPEGVRGRNSDNKFIEKSLGWSPSWPLQAGIEKTYDWILSQVNQQKQ